MALFSRILGALSGQHDDPLPEPDANLALGALMVRVAKSDSNYKVEEIARIDRLLARLHGIGPVEAAKMRATCEKLETEAPRTGGFAQLIFDSVPPEGRRDALTALCEVMMADGVEHAEEHAVITATGIALGLGEEDITTARATARARADEAGA